MPHLSFNRHGEEDADVVAVDPLACMGGGGTGQKLSRRRSLLTSFKKWRGRHQDFSPLPTDSATREEEEHEEAVERKVSLGRRVSNPELVPKGSRRVVPSLPRPQTFHRRESERRERLLEVPVEEWERREDGQERRRGWSVGELGRRGLKKGDAWDERRQGEWLGLSVPEVATLQEERHGAIKEQPGMIEESGHEDDSALEPALPEWDDDDFPPQHGSYDYSDPDYPSADTPSETSPDPSWLQSEYDRRWILNLSMSFRDKSQREKFFVTYAETPTLWRRLTISLDYRAAPQNSLEADLVDMHYQRDKSFRVFEAIYESLADIAYYPTVTNLKLQTTPDDGQLHVHVREDANEIIDYPPSSLCAHINVPRYPESSLELDSHLSGFVYKVSAPSPSPSSKREVLVKKEIPGPDTIDEFLYEANALAALSDHPNIITLRGLVTTPSGEQITGLVLDHAPGGALIDVLYDPTPSSLPFSRIQKWAHQIVSALSAIHETGFVQGDFTLSNIVLDAHDNAVVIDVNRRGCPVGWEPPELGTLIDNGQRIGLNIGVKTDLWQCGMVLWALARGTDEPERCRPLEALTAEDAPKWYREVVESCLSEKPQGRKSAGESLGMFPREAATPPASPDVQHLHAWDFDTRGARFDDPRTPSPAPSAHDHRHDRRYIDPALSITLSDVHNRHPHSPPPTYNTEDTPRHHARGSSDSWLGRGRSPGRRSSFGERDAAGFGAASGSSATSVSSPSRSRMRERSRSMSLSASPAARRGRIYRYDDECEVEVFDEPSAEADDARAHERRDWTNSPVRQDGEVGGVSFEAPDPPSSREGVGFTAKAGGSAGKERPDDDGSEEVYPPPLHQDSGFGDAEPSLLRDMVAQTNGDPGTGANEHAKSELEQRDTETLWKL